MKKPIFAIFTLLLWSSLLCAQDFRGSFKLHLTNNFQNGNERQDSVSYFFDDQKTAIIIYGRRNQPDMRLVFDTAQKTITALFTNNGKKGGYVLPMNEIYWPGMPQSNPGFASVPSESAIATPTENTKTIDGYLCQEFTAETEEYSFTLWVANDINLSMTRVLSYQSVGKEKSKEEVNLYSRLGIDKLPLEMQLKSKTGKPDVFVKISDIKENVDPLIFSMAGYEVHQIEQ